MPRERVRVWSENALIRIQYSPFFFSIWSGMEWFQIFILEFRNWCNLWTAMCYAPHKTYKSHITYALYRLDGRKISRFYHHQSDNYACFYFIARIFLLFLLLLSVKCKNRNWMRHAVGFARWKCVNISFTYTLTHFLRSASSIVFAELLYISPHRREKETEKETHLIFHFVSKHTDLAYLMSVPVHDQTNTHTRGDFQICNK